jgi:putative flippase GtrA
MWLGRNPRMKALTAKTQYFLETLFSHQFVRFLAVGGLNTAIGYAIYAILILLGLVPELALLVATIIGIMVNYFTTGRMVFGNRGNGLFFKFMLVYAVMYVLNAVALRGLLLAGIAPLIAQAIILPVTAIATFLAFRKLVFRKNGQQ